MYLEERINSIERANAAITQRLEEIIGMLRKMDLAERTEIEMSTGEVAKYIGVSRSTVNHLVANKEIPYYKSKSGCRNVFLKSEIDAWKNSKRSIKIYTTDELKQQAQVY